MDMGAWRYARLVKMLQEKFAEENVDVWISIVKWPKKYCVGFVDFFAQKCTNEMVSKHV